MEHVNKESIIEELRKTVEIPVTVADRRIELYKIINIVKEIAEDFLVADYSSIFEKIQTYHLLSSRANLLQAEVAHAELIISTEDFDDDEDYLLFLARYKSLYEMAKGLLLSEYDD